MKRIIARLDVKPPNVIKPIQFEGLRKIGNPNILGKKYFNEGADEILYLDAVSSLYQRDIDYSVIEKASNGIFIPYAVGGGVNKLSDYPNLLKNGADKVVINTYAFRDPNIIKSASQICGSQSVVVHIEAKRWDDWWECYTDGGRIRTGIDVFDWALKVQELGAGEIIISAVDNDGMLKGFDLELIKKMTNLLHIPVIASSGAGSMQHVLDLFNYANPDAVSISSALHYNLFDIIELKKYLYKNGIDVAL